MRFRSIGGWVAMFLLGLCSILQIVFLPGFLILRGLRLDVGPVRTWIWSFALSLVVNHVLVLGLVLLKIYRAPVMYGIFAAEMVALVWTSRRLLFEPVAKVLHLRGPWYETLHDNLRRAMADRRAAVRLVVLTAVWMLVLAYAAAEFSQFGAIFTSSDTVACWNRWAIEWAQGMIPHGTGEFPQLLPCNYSLTYVFIGDTGLWFFAKAIAFLFCLLLLAGILDLYYQTGMFGYVLGVAFTYGLLWAFIRYRNLSSGSADVPLAFMAMASVSALIFARRAKDRLKLKYVLLGAALAGGTALTKQGGVAMALLYPLLAWLIVYRRGSPAPSSNRQTVGAMIGAVLIPLVLIGPWYTYKVSQFVKGSDQPVLWSMIQDRHADRTPLERVGYAELLIEKHIPFAVWIVIVPLLLLALWDPVHRWLVMLVILPFFFVWSVGFSYETGNLAMIAPLAGVAMGLGLMQFGPSRRRPPRRVPDAAERATGGPWSLRVVHVVGLGVVLAVVANGSFTRESLAGLQQDLQRQVGSPEVNERLYEFAGRHGFHGDILSDYSTLTWLPEIGQRCRPIAEADLNEFRKAYEDPGVECALLQAWQTPEIQAYLDHAVEHGSTRLEFEFSDYRLYRKVQR
jgi:hypothetical protein